MEVFLPKRLHAEKLREVADITDDFFSGIFGDVLMGSTRIDLEGFAA